MVVASTRSGNVIMTMIAVMDLTNPKIAKTNTGNVTIQNSLVKMPNVFPSLTSVTAKMTAETVQMSSNVTKRTITAPARRMSSNARVCPVCTTRNVFHTIWYVIRKKIVRMVQMNPYIVESMNAHVFKTMDVIINVLIQKKASNVNVMKGTDSWRMAKLAKTSTNVMKSREHVANSVSIHLADTTANVTKITTSVNPMARLVSVWMTRILGWSLATSTTSAT